MKAINYRGQNDFYLFDKPEEPKYGKWFFDDKENLRKSLEFNKQLKANLSAGKKIINPEVLGLEELESLPVKYVHDGKILKPGDIFPLPDNIGFEEKLQLIRDKKGFEQYVDFIRLFPKQEPVETQESVMDDMLSQYFKMISEGKSMHYAVQNLKSKFTITRNT